ncbi:hypothetical protein B296_00011186 [Ensete ventricosum]|uniref:Uncharacterized protein n=1 Tax=Ensete ventricosum TaxID=4639 RepID=A0A427B8P3_ENSVE|nr:hypothetical protein B296_00011186 [Ensete ventricosum]
MGDGSPTEDKYRRRLKRSKIYRVLPRHEHTVMKLHVDHAWRDREDTKKNWSSKLIYGDRTMHRHFGKME